MSGEKFKTNSVIIDGGSGVLYQPYNIKEFTYILSAKHNFYVTTGSEKIIKETISVSFHYDQESKIQIFIHLGDNYFEHSDSAVDAAILKIDYNENAEEIFIDEDCRVFNECTLCGYPTNLRGNNNDKFTSYNIKHKITTTQYGKYLRLQSDFGNLAHEDFIGFSGGGIFRENNNSINLIGIQSSSTSEYTNGQIDIIPSALFNKIITENNLPELLPSFLKKINILSDEALKFESVIAELRPKLINAINAKLHCIRLELADLYSNGVPEKMSLSNDAKKSRNFWVSFIEYALIISIISDESIDETTLKKVINSKKFIFSNTNKNFFEIIRDILEMDLKEIENGCQILIGSNNTPPTKRRILLDNITANIADATKYYTIDRVPYLQKIKEIIHLKAFELDCITQNEIKLNSYNHFQIPELLTELKNLINDFLSTSN